ncbi:MAG: hypothetical protein IJY45_01200 [Tidjanibacter sp.]|nr:hypothetical protein [Tidjanibacter sp.]
MKKIFYYLMSAVVAFGAMACQNDIEENVTPGEGGNGEKVSFVAEVGDVTRVAIGDKVDGKYRITLDADDVLIAQYYKSDTEEWSTAYTFETTDGKNFSCETPGVSELIGKEVTINNRAVTSFCSLCGVDGFQLRANVASFGDNSNITLEVANAVLMFESEYDVTFNSTGELFSYDSECGLLNNPANNVNSLKIPASEGVHYVAVNGGIPTTFSYSIDDVMCKEITTTFEGGKLYNLGTLGKLNTEWELMGGWEGSEWTTKFLYNEGYNNIFVARNVNVTADSEFLIRLYQSWDDKVALYEGSSAAVDYWYDAKKNSEDGKFNTNIGIAKGVYDIWFDQQTYSFMIATKGKTPAFYSVIGTINNGNWDTDNDMVLEDGWFVATVDAKANNEFKIRKCHTWDMTHGYGDWFEAGKELVSDNGGNFKIAAEGKYKISMKKDTSKIKIEKL